MTISSTAELRNLASSAIGNASDLLSAEEIDLAVLKALNELGVSLPLDNKGREFWLVERTQRHCLDVLRSSSAHKFRYKQINLSHRFEHYHAMVQSMDDRFIQALNSDPALALVDGSNLFLYIGSGFNYGELGEDLTYLDNIDGY